MFLNFRITENNKKKIDNKKTKNSYVNNIKIFIKKYNNMSYKIQI